MVRAARLRSTASARGSPPHDFRCATHNRAAGSDRAGACLSPSAHRLQQAVRCRLQIQPGTGPKTLADYIDVRGVYPAGRLDTDSEGLLLLTDDGVLQARIAEPKHEIAKVYWAQVEGSPSTSGARVSSGKACVSATSRRSLRTRISSRNRRISGPEIRRSAIVRAFRPHGSSSRYVKERTAKCGA